VLIVIELLHRTYIVLILVTELCAAAPKCYAVLPPPRQSINLPPLPCRGKLCGSNLTMQEGKLRLPFLPLSGQEEKLCGYQGKVCVENKSEEGTE